jgi:nucleoside-diphosphate-sugar epimerase
MNAASISSIIVTGAGGFVGRHIVDALVAAGRQVIATDQQFDADLRGRWDLLPAVTLIKTDTADAFATALAGLSADALIHGAAVTASADEIGLAPEALYRANLDPLLAALAWTREHQPQRAIFISSAAVFRGSDAPVLKETTPLPPGTQGIYPAAKLASETLVRTLRVEDQLDAVSIRLGNVYGTEEIGRRTRPRVSQVAAMIEQAVNHGFIEVPEQGAALDWTNAADIGRACVALLDAPSLPYDLYHVVSPEAVTPHEIAAAIQAVLPEVDIRLTHNASTSSRGVLTSEHFEADAAFSTWTAFLDGMAAVVKARLQQREKQVMP